MTKIIECDITNMKEADLKDSEAAVIWKWIIPKNIAYLIGYKNRKRNIITVVISEDRNKLYIKM